MDDPYVEVEIKPQLKPRGSVAKEVDKTFPPGVQAADCTTKQTLCQWTIYKDIESSHERKCTSCDSCGHWRLEHTEVGPD